MLAKRAELFRRSSLYLVTPIAPSAGGLEEVVSGAIDGGATVIQLRDKQASDTEILAAASRLKPICVEREALLIINDRPDLAAQAQADGVHVGQDDAGIPQVRQAVGPELLIGLSTHNPAQIDASASSGADYIGVGPVFATPTKAGKAAVGTELVAYAAAHSALPFVAIGGINSGNADEVAAAGAQRVAVVRAITESSDSRAAAATLSAQLRASSHD